MFYNFEISHYHSNSCLDYLSFCFVAFDIMMFQVIHPVAFFRYTTQIEREFVYKYCKKKKCDQTKKHNNKYIPIVLISIMPNVIRIHVM